MSDPTLESLLEKAERGYKEALLEEQKAQSQLDKFARTKPLSPMEVPEATDGDALGRAQQRKRAATERRQRKQREYRELLRRRDELDR